MRLISIAFVAFVTAACAERPRQADRSAATRPVEQPAYKKVIVFGDSLVDAGNVHLLTRGQYAAPRQGFVEGRFTNGFTFADRIAMAVEGRVTTPSRAGGNNYAYGGARALENNDGIPDAARQVETWRSSLPGRADPDSLFIVTFGGNDLRHPPADNRHMDAYHRAVAQSYAKAVQDLFELGARTVLVTGAPLPNEAGAALQRRLDVELDRIKLTDGRRLLRYDFLPFWRSLLSEAARLGFRPWSSEAAASATMPGAKRVSGDDCLGDAAQAEGCPGYVLFDRVHPTAAVHALIARDMAARLAVPVADPPAQPKR